MWEALPGILRHSIGLKSTYITSNSQKGLVLSIVTLKNKKTKRRDRKAREGLRIPKEGREEGIQRDLSWYWVSSRELA